MEVPPADTIVRFGDVHTALTQGETLESGNQSGRMAPRFTNGGSMKKVLYVGSAIVCGAVLTFASMYPVRAQDKPAPIPQLSTADRTALSAMEVKKQEAQKTFSDAQQVELSILKEFEVSHPGFIVNPQTFVVEQKVKPKAKAEEKPAESEKK